MAVADPRVMYAAASNGGLLDAFATMQNRITGERVIGILGAAQIDKYGNMNSTSIGDYYRPNTRFSGSGGPSAVVTNLAMLRFDEKTREMYLAHYYPGISPRKILDNMEFTVDASRATEATPPTASELKVLREVVDPQRIIL